MTYTDTDTLRCDDCLEPVGTDYGSTLDRVDLTEPVYIIDGGWYCLGCAENRVTYLENYLDLEGTITYNDLGIN
jgi:hypothetical protein